MVVTIIALYAPSIAVVVSVILDLDEPDGGLFGVPQHLNAQRARRHDALSRLAIDSPVRAGQASSLMQLHRDLRRRPFLLAAAAVLGFALRPGGANAQASDATAQGALFEQNCAACHAIPATRAPNRASLRAMSPNFIVESLTHGMMKAQGSDLTAEERIALAEYLTGRKVGAEALMAGRCAAASPPLSLDGPSFNG